VIEDQIKNIESGTNLESLHEAKRLTAEMKRAILRGDIPSVGELLRAGWGAKRRFSPRVTTEQIDEFHNRLTTAGMIGGKVTGAGGGGHFLAFADLSARHRVVEAACDMGAIYVPVSLCQDGVTTWHVSP